jgi:hypothetical protein
MTVQRTSPDAGRRALESHSRDQLGTGETKAEKFNEETSACHGTEARKRKSWPATQLRQKGAWAHELGKTRSKPVTPNREQDP